MSARYLVVWFYNRGIRSAVAETYEIAAKYAAERNAVVVETFGERIEFGRIEDWYRRNDKGEPLPTTWRDLEKSPRRID